LTKKIIISAAIVLLAFSSSFGREINKNAGTSAFSFLKINVGARAVSLGGAFTGLANDESALYYNPAGIASFEEERIILGYHNYFIDIQSGIVGYIRPIKPQYVLGLQLSYLNYGDFTETDKYGEVLGQFSGGDLLLATTVGYQYNPNYSFGVTAKFIYEKLQDYSSTGIAADLGFKYTADRDRYSLGLMIQNLGTQLSALGDEKDDLPLTLRGGGAITPRGLPLTLSGDVILPRDNNVDVAAGVEYFKFQPLYVRLGWNSFGSNYRASDSDDKWAGLSFGAGFAFRSRWQLSYAYSPAAELGESHRVTLTGRI